MSKDEYGLRCESCYKYERSRMYYKPVKGQIGKNRDTLKFRRLCIKCWLMAEEGENGKA